MAFHEPLYGPGRAFFTRRRRAAKLITRDPRRSGGHWSVWASSIIAAYSPQARGRSEPVFHTLRGRLVKELALKEINAVEAANLFLRDVYIPEHNARFAVAAAQEGTAFVGDPRRRPCGILCVQEERQVGNDNCVSFNRLNCRIPESPLRPFRQDARESAPISRWNPCDFLRAAMPWTLR